jgi:release factor glutamine methyltransferase
VSPRVEALLAVARERLSQADFRPPTREAALLMAHALGTREAQVIAHPERELADAEHRRFTELLERRLRGEPVAYLFGEREFWGRPFKVDRRVLIPRPETEHLVEAALQLADPGARVLDLGTGSGCVALTMALERPDLKVFGVDVSVDALAVARLNARRLGGAVAWVAADLLSSLSLARADVVVANLPYVATGDALSVEVREHEPASALFAGYDGLSLFKRLLPRLVDLRPGVSIALELGAGQADALEKLAREYDLRPVGRRRDYAGHERIVIIER